MVTIVILRFALNDRQTDRQIHLFDQNKHN